MASWRAIFHLVFGDGGPADIAGTKVLVTMTQAGVTLDFPLAPDLRRLADDRAWRIFTVAIILLVGSLLWFSVCQVLHWHDYQGFSLLMFVLGILGLIAAVTSSSSARQHTECNDDLRQLAVVGDLLIRTSRDQRKRILYRQEVRAILVEDVVITNTKQGAAGIMYLTIHAVHLLVELHSGEKVLFIGRAMTDPASDHRLKAELEGIAGQLRHALWRNLPPPWIPENTTSSHAIQEKVDYSEEERFTQ
jgi:hypothetical protein